MIKTLNLFIDENMPESFDDATAFDALAAKHALRITAIAPSQQGSYDVTFSGAPESICRLMVEVGEVE